MNAPRYIPIPEGNWTPFEQGVIMGRALAGDTHWLGPENTPENICFCCGHPRSSHLDQPHLKGGPPESDRGWTTLPPGKCIHDPCTCTSFVEPSDEEIDCANRKIG